MQHITGGKQIFKKKERKKKGLKTRKKYAHMLLSTNAIIISLDKLATHYDKVVEVATPFILVITNTKATFGIFQHQAEVAGSRMQ